MKSLARISSRSGTTLWLLMLAGCTSYHPHPLPSAPDLVQTPSVSVPAKTFQVPGLAPHAISPDGLDELTVMTLAVADDPDLKAARVQAGIAEAQTLQAGLLPDPQFGAGFATSAMNYGGALTLGQDIQSLVTRGAAKAAAQASATQVNLNILWQEIQVAERARELFIQQQSDSKLQQVLSSNHALLQENYTRDRAAMERGDALAGTVAADLILLSNADTAVRQLQSEINISRHQLNGLLGLQPDTDLPLIGSIDLRTLSKSEFERALSLIPNRRADLLALQAGYRSQEENVRRTILAQFPAMTAGMNFERDPVEGVNAIGPQVTLTLPLFNRNRGQIAIERATREMLQQQYQARLDAAVSQADQVWQATQIMAAQLKTLDTQLPVLEETSQAAERSFHQGNLNAALYVNSRTAFVTKQSEQIRLQQSLASANAALDTLLGLPMDSR